MATFGERLKTLRTAKGLTQEGLARAADLSSATVAKLEHVKGMDPSWSTVVKLADALNVSTDAFRSDHKEEGPPVKEMPAKRQTSRATRKRDSIR